MNAPATAYEWRGRELSDRDGETIGTIAEIYVDPESERPEWATVNSGILGKTSHFVPLTGATAAGEGISVGVTREQVRTAPPVATDAELLPEAEAELCTHYGIALRAEPTRAPADGDQLDRGRVRRSFADEPVAGGEHATERSGDARASAGTEAEQGPDGAPQEPPTVGWNAADWRGKMLYDENGEKIGKLQEIYVDVETDEPQFGTVKEGFIGRHLTFVPLGGINIAPDHLQVPVTRERVQDAPNIEQHGEELSQADESSLYHHFELNYTPPATDSGRRLARR